MIFVCFALRAALRASCVEITSTEEIFTSQEEVTEFESSFCLLNVDGDYRGEKDKEEEPYVFIIGAIEEERNICRIPTENMANTKKNSIILPYYLAVANS